MILETFIPRVMAKEARTDELRMSGPAQTLCNVYIEKNTIYIYISDLKHKDPETIALLNGKQSTTRIHLEGGRLQAFRASAP